MKELSSKDTKVLIYLLENEWANISRIQEYTKMSQFAVYNAISRITKLGLIIERRGERNAREFSLTEKGKEVALAAKKLRETLDND